MRVEASCMIEMTLSVQGVYQPGCKAWGGSRLEPPINPPEPDSMEDVEGTGFTGAKRVWDRVEGSHLPVARWTEVSLLEGVNLKSPDVQKLLENIAAHFSESIDEALLGEVCDD